MSNLTLYSDPRLPCPQRVLLTAEELGIELNIIPIDITSNEHKVQHNSCLEIQYLPSRPLSSPH